MKYSFKCRKCSSTLFARPNGMEKLTFYEGHFICIGCEREVPYHDEDWIRHEEPKQLSLFENEQDTGANITED